MMQKRQTAKSKMTRDDYTGTDPDKQRKGYNEQNPTQPHGSFKPDADATKKTTATSTKKRAEEKKI